jgi:small basic protein (TIGR04137 family)
MMPECSGGKQQKMSIHRTLKTGDGLKGTRNVLTRYERILQLEAQGRFTEGEDFPIGLPKTRVLKVKKRAKVKKEKEDKVEGEQEQEPEVKE